jgi:Ca-activated chloride channel family protein
MFLVFSLLDPRGAVIKVEGSIPDQKTVMLIDTSSSMFVEDVRPNRYKRAILLARHFVKKAVGHQISIVLFSDIQKRIVPFTDDLDLLDARLTALENDIGAGGGSNLSQAIEESLQYFKTTEEKDGIRSGNLLILTDSEGHDGALSNDVSEKINVAMIGVGTARGGKVPIRDSRGVFRGYKKHKGVEVESKLNEKWMKSLSDKIKSYKYWIANSYSIPTVEIVDFFRGRFTKSLSKGNVNIKPVLYHKTALVGILLIILSNLLYPFKSFSTLVLATCLIFGAEIRADVKHDHEKSEVEKSYELESKFKNGDISEDELIYFIEELLKDKSFEKASLLYEERINKLDPMSLNNYGLALIALKKEEKALEIFRSAETDLLEMSESGELLKAVRKNILLLIKKEKKKKDQKKKEKKGDEKKENKKKNKDNKEQKKHDKEDKKSKDQKNEKDKKEKQNDNKPSKEKSKDKKKDKDSKSKKSDNKKKNKKDNENENENENENKKEKKGKEKKDKPKSMKQLLKEKEDRNKLKRKMKKIPGVIKQIMSNDRELQRKHIDTSTKERSNYKKRDW